MMTTPKTLSFYLVLIVSLLTTARCDLGVETSRPGPASAQRAQTRAVGCSRSRARAGWTASSLVPARPAAALLRAGDLSEHSTAGERALRRAHSGADRAGLRAGQNECLSATLLSTLFCTGTRRRAAHLRQLTGLRAGLRVGESVRISDSVVDSFWTGPVSVDD